MSSINVIPTTQVAAGSQSGQALSGSQTGVFATTEGMNFFDLIIARLAALTEGEEGAENKAQGVTNAVITADSSVKTDSKTLSSRMDNNPLAALQIALAAQTVDGEGNILLPLSEKGTEKLQTQLDFTNQLINHLKNVLPDSAEQAGIFSKLLTKLQAKSETLQASLSTLESGVITKDTPVEDIPLPLLIALGLKPSEITEVTEKIDALEEKLGREITVEDLIAGVGGLIPSASETAVLAASFQQSPKAVALQQPIESDPLNIDENAEPTDDLAARLNAMDVGGEDMIGDEKKLEQPIQARSAKEDIPADNTKPAADAQSNDKKPVMNIKEHLVNITNGHKSAQGEMVFPLTMFDGDVDASLFQSYGLNGTPSLSLGTTAQAANVIATSVSAGMSHPATGTVAAQIVKFAGQGENQTFNLRLDPPELGNVNIRLQFGKDKSVKAHLTIEKPETYMMLSRDAHALERALQNAGLDAGANNISFELADNGFNNNGEGGGEKNFGGGNAGTQNADAGDEIIQSTVTWQIDPSTGHVRYNIFA